MTARLLVLPFLLALVFGKALVPPTSLNSLRGIVSNNIESKVNDKISTNMIGSINELAAYAGVERAERAPKELGEARAVEPTLAATIQPVEAVKELQPVRLQPIRSAIQKEYLQPAALSLRKDLVKTELQPVRLVQLVPTKETEKAEIDLPYENVVAIKQNIREEVAPVKVAPSVKVIECFQEPVRTTTIQPIEATIQPVYNTKIPQILPVQTVQSTPTVQQPILIATKLPTATKSLPILTESKPLQPVQSTLSLQSYQTQPIPASISQAKSATIAPAVLDYALPVTNTILGKNNVVSGLQNRISASNSNVVGHGNIIIDGNFAL